MALCAAALLASSSCRNDEVSLGDDRPQLDDGGPAGEGPAAGSSGSQPAAGVGGTGGSVVPPPGFPPVGAPCGSHGLVCPRGQFCQFDADDDCGIDDQAGHCEPQPRNCTTESAPVCGCDGASYLNPCFAAFSGISVQHAGRCKNSGSSGNACGGFFSCPGGEFCRFGRDSGCGVSAPGVCTRVPPSCSREARLVCGCDGRTYTNECVAAMDGVSVRRSSECNPDGGAPPMDGGMSRICGGADELECEDHEYCNLAAVDGCDVPQPRGECRPKPTGCSEIIDPVCGCDGFTFPNPCVAAENGASIDHGGECR
jgi:hypothetical protein